MSRRSVSLSCALTLVWGLLLLGTAAPASAQTAFSYSAQLPLSSYGDQVVDPVKGRVYVSSLGGDHRIAVTDLSGHLVDVLEGLAGSHRLAVSDDGASLFVATVDGRVQEVDTDSLTVSREFEVPDDGIATDVAVSGSDLWTVVTSNSCCPWGELHRLDLSTGQWQIVPGIPSVSSVVSTGDARVLAGDRHTYKVYSIDTSTLQIEAQRTFSGSVQRVDESTTSGDVFVTWHDSSLATWVTFIDPASLLALHSVRLGANVDAAPSRRTDSSCPSWPRPTRATHWTW
jgi:DNA-binding beta-propeller fold protein YncE